MNTRELAMPTGIAATAQSALAQSHFDEQTVQAVWLKAKPAAGWASFRKDTAGEVIHRRMYGIPAKWGWRIAHIVPPEKGGSNAVDNLHALHWERFEENRRLRELGAAA